MIDDRPAVSVIIPTRDRVAHLRRAVASVLANSDPALELIVADQSDGEESARFLQSVAASDARIVPLRLTSTGKARGVNKALRRARAEVIAFTDDDCTVPADWLQCHLATLAREPEVGIVFGRVDAAPHDPMEAWIPTFQPRRYRRLRGRYTRANWSGMGANMVVRRAVIDRQADFMKAPGQAAHPAAATIGTWSTTRCAWGSPRSRIRAYQSYIGARDPMPREKREHSSPIITSVSVPATRGARAVATCSPLCSSFTRWWS
jgi:hypothetical protein